MNLLLKPGARLLERFRFSQKFLLIALIFILPLGYAIWSISADHARTLENIAQKQSGVRQLRALDHVDVAIMTSRNLAARWKSQDTTTKASRMPILVNSAAWPIGSSPAIAADAIPTIQVIRVGTCRTG